MPRSPTRKPTKIKVYRVGRLGDRVEALQGLREICCTKLRLASWKNVVEEADPRMVHSWYQQMTKTVFKTNVYPIQLDARISAYPLRLYMIFPDNQTLKVDEYGCSQVIVGEKL
jgi:hypothetical protein